MVDFDSNPDKKKLIKTAKEIFKHITGYCKDRSCKKQLEEGMAVVTIGREQQALRDEIFCQLIKQTTKNPTPEKEVFAWKLTWFCLCCFLPSRPICDILQSHIASKARAQQTKYMPFNSVPDASANCWKQLHRAMNNSQCLVAPVMDTLCKVTDDADTFSPAYCAMRGAMESAGIPQARANMKLIPIQRPAGGGAQPIGGMGAQPAGKASSRAAPAYQPELEPEVGANAPPAPPPPPMGPSDGPPPPDFSGGGMGGGEEEQGGYGAPQGGGGGGYGAPPARGGGLLDEIKMGRPQLRAIDPNEQPKAEVQEEGESLSALVGKALRDRRKGMEGEDKSDSEEDPEWND